MTVSLVDYGLGNLGSVANMLKRVGVQSRRVTTPEEVLDSERVLLPGVGAFDTGVRLLKESGLHEGLQQFARTGRPLLGICLGMQLLVDTSAEGSEHGLGLIPGHCQRFVESPRLRVPHMGWNHARALRSDSLLHGVMENSRYYFVHSYHVVPSATEDALAETEYGNAFVSMVRRENVMGAQFHPEKSHTFGMTILRNFANI